MPQTHRSLFLSDLHLGAFGSRADLTLRFLRRNMADSYVLVGDILDLGGLARPRWGAAQQAVIDHLRQRHQEGARLVYVRGNHDPDPESAPDALRLPVTSQDEAVHEAADGRRYLVTHGHGQDMAVMRGRIATWAGARAEQGLRAMDGVWRQLAGRRLRHRRSPIEWLLAQSNALLSGGIGHELRLVALARERGMDGVISGHYHAARLHTDHGLVYANCGDWLDNFTGLAESFDGSFQILGGRQALLPHRVGLGGATLAGAVRA